MCGLPGVIGLRMEDRLAADSSTKNETLQSVALTLSILEKLAVAQSGIGVSGLAADLGTSKSRVHRHLRTLVGLGYVSQETNSERYRIGSRLIALGRAASGSADLVGVAQPYLRGLRDETGLAVSLSGIEDEGVRILTSLSGTNEIEVAVRPGTALGFFNSAQGKVVMSLMDGSSRDRLIANWRRASPNISDTDEEALRQKLEEVATSGWATAPNEAMLGLNALACPVFGGDGELAGTIALVGLTEFIATPPSQTQITAVLQAAGSISKALGKGDL